eukprot:5638862-Ditylum_brightwellii.AAC.1
MTVHYLAAGGGNGCIVPLARRLRHLCMSRLSSNRKRSNKHLVQLFERVVFTTVSDGYEVLAALAKIESSLSSLLPERDGSSNDNGHGNDNEGGDDTSNNDILVVLDSANGCLKSNLFSDFLDGDVGFALVNEVALTLKRLARDSSYTFQNDDDDINDAGGGRKQKRRNNAKRRRFAILVTNDAVTSTANITEGGGGGLQQQQPRVAALGQRWNAAD